MIGLGSDKKIPNKLQLTKMKDRKTEIGKDNKQDPKGFQTKRIKKYLPSFLLLKMLNIWPKYEIQMQAGLGKESEGR